MKASKRSKGNLSKIFMFQMTLIFLLFIQRTKEQIRQCHTGNSKDTCPAPFCSYDFENNVCNYVPCNDLTSDVCSDSDRCVMDPKGSGVCIPKCSLITESGTIEICKSLHSIGECDVDISDHSKFGCKDFNCSNQGNDTCLSEYGCEPKDGKCETKACDDGVQANKCIKKFYGSCSYREDKCQEKSCADLGTDVDTCNWKNGGYVNGDPCILKDGQCVKLTCADITVDTNTDKDGNICLESHGNLRCGYSSGTSEGFCSDYNPGKPVVCSDIKQEDDCRSSELNCRWNPYSFAQRRRLAEGGGCYNRTCEDSKYKEACEDQSHGGDFCKWEKVGGNDGGTCIKKSCQEITEEKLCHDSKLDGECYSHKGEDGKETCDETKNFKICSDIKNELSCKNQSASTFCDWKEGTCTEKICSTFNEQNNCENEKLNGKCYWGKNTPQGEEEAKYQCLDSNNFEKCSDLGKEHICKAQGNLCEWKGEGEDVSCQEKDCTEISQEFCLNTKLAGKCRWNSDLETPKCIKKVAKCEEWIGIENKEYCNTEKSTEKGCYFDETDNLCKDNTCATSCKVCSTDQECQANTKCFYDSSVTDGTKCRDKTCEDIKVGDDCKSSKDKISRECHWDEEGSKCLELDCNKYCEDCSKEECPNSSAGCELKKEEGAEEKCVKKGAKASCSDYNKNEVECKAALEKTKSLEIKLDCFYEESSTNCVDRKCNEKCEHCTPEECPNSEVGCALGNENKCTKKISCEKYENENDCNDAKNSEGKSICFFDNGSPKCVERKCDENCNHCTKEECTNSSKGCVFLEDSCILKECNKFCGHCNTNECKNSEAGCFLKDNKCTENICKDSPHMEGETTEECKCASPYKIITVEDENGKKIPKCVEPMNLELTLKVDL